MTLKSVIGPVEGLYVHTVTTNARQCRGLSRYVSVNLMGFLIHLNYYENVKSRPNLVSDGHIKVKEPSFEIIAGTLSPVGKAEIPAIKIASGKLDKRYDRILVRKSYRPTFSAEKFTSNLMVLPGMRPRGPHRCSD